MEERSIPHRIKRKKGNWNGHVLRINCLLLHVIERKIELTGRRGGRRKQLLVGRKEGRRFYNLKEKALGRTLWITRFQRDCGPVTKHCVRNYCILHPFGNILVNKWQLTVNLHAVALLRTHESVLVFLNVVVGRWSTSTRNVWSCVLKLCVVLKH